MYVKCKNAISRIKFSYQGLFKILLISSCFLLHRQQLLAQTYVQVPATGGAISPTADYGPCTTVDVRAAMLYKASELRSIPVGMPINSLGLKLNGPSVINVTGSFKMYIIPTTDTVYTLNTSWIAIEQKPGFTQIFNGYITIFNPQTGYLDFNLTTPFTLAPNQGFYLVYESSSGYPSVKTISFECNTTMPNSYKIGLSNSHMPKVAPAVLTNSNSFRHVLRLGYMDPTGISETEMNNVVSIYPNPVNDKVTIKINEKFINPEAEATVSSIEGKLIRKVKLTGKGNQVNLSGIKPGIYLVKITAANQSIVKKIVIE